MADERDTHIGKNLAAHRGVRSQTELARAMRNRGWKWSQSTVWAIEKGDRPIKLAEAVDLADELRVRIGDLVQQPEKAAATHEVTYYAREVVSHGNQVIKTLVEFGRKRRQLKAAIEGAEKIPGWRRPKSNDLISALDYSFDKLVHLARLQLDADVLKPFNIAELTPEQIANLPDGAEQEGNPHGIDQETP